MTIFTKDGQIDPDAREVLYEIGNVGAGSAMTPIGNMRKMEFHVSTPQVFTLDENLFQELNYAPEQVVVGVTTKMNESINGSILFLLSMEFVCNTVEIMTGTVYSENEILTDEDSVSAIHEMVNYMTAGYVKVLGTYLEMPVYISPASLGIDSVKNILQQVMKQRQNEIDKIACVDTKFLVVDEQGNETHESGQVLIFPDEECVNRLIQMME